MKHIDSHAVAYERICNCDSSFIDLALELSKYINQSKTQKVNIDKIENGKFC